MKAAGDTRRRVRMAGRRVEVKTGEGGAGCAGNRPGPSVPTGPWNWPRSALLSFFSVQDW